MITKHIKLWRYACAVLLPGLLSMSASSAPTLFIAGDSTAAKYDGPDQQGWAEPFANYFDPAKITIANRALGGRSSRTFITEGHWDALLAELHAGDFVLIQFGHNDAGALNEEPPGSTRPLRARGTIPGVGEETQEIDNVITKKHEVVHTFGWYISKMIEDARARGAHPIVLSLTLRNDWTDGHITCRGDAYRQWDLAIAKAHAVPFVDVSRIIAARYQRLGQDAVAKFFIKDPVHTNLAGADINAQAVVAGLRALHIRAIDAALSSKGKTIRADNPKHASDCAPILDTPR
jgi:lysophospholipase L1-like esterase